MSFPGQNQKKKSFLKYIDTTFFLCQTLARSAQIFLKETRKMINVKFKIYTSCNIRNLKCQINANTKYKKKEPYFQTD